MPRSKTPIVSLEEAKARFEEWRNNRRGKARIPRAASWEELNAHLLEECRKRREWKLWGHEETIVQRFERDREKLLPLPATPYCGEGKRKLIVRHALLNVSRKATTSL